MDQSFLDELVAIYALSEQHGISEETLEDIVERMQAEFLVTNRDVLLAAQQDGWEPLVGIDFIDYPHLAQKYRDAYLNQKEFVLPWGGRVRLDTLLRYVLLRKESLAYHTPGEQRVLLSIYEQRTFGMDEADGRVMTRLADQGDVARGQLKLTEQGKWALFFYLLKEGS